MADWEDWLASECFEGCHHEIERDALAAVVPLLRSTLPTAEAVVGAAGMEMDAEPEIAAAGGMVTRVLYELACEKLAGRSATKGIVCPGCGNFSTDFKYVRVKVVSESGPQSQLICQNCGKEFGPADV